MPVVIVEMWEGHTLDQKRQLAREMTEAMTRIGEPAESVQVIMRESPKSCWSDAGKLCADFEIPPGA